MATKIVMAQLSPTMEEGKLIAWRVAEGDTISQGDIVAEIETDKANMEIEALGSGVLKTIVVEAGRTVPVGALIGVIAEPEESIDDMLASAKTADTTKEAGSPDSQTDLSIDTQTPVTTAQSTGTTSKDVTRAVDPKPITAQPDPVPSITTVDGRVKASPVARRMALEAGIDVAMIAGSGPGGRVVKSDLEAVLATKTSTPPPQTIVKTAPEIPVSVDLAPRIEEASQMRKAIARRLVQSIGPIPHFFLTTEIDMGRALELQTDLNDRFPGEKIGVNDLLLKAAAEALTRHPTINASWENDTVRYHGTVDLSIAVAVEGGLITPVLRDAGRKELRQISVEAHDLIERARGKALQPEEYQNGTFSVSNLGMFAIDQFTAIINPPEAGILAIGRTVEKPVVVAGEVQVRKRMRATMSCDHRIIDGASGAEFLDTFKAILENPLHLIL
jgi:pyruvate dehydrogenase E2 component (dihydrolipoamide acetyltransferase)